MSRSKTFAITYGCVYYLNGIHIIIFFKSINVGRRYPVFHTADYTLFSFKLN